MERIKQALDRSRVEREQAGPGSGAAAVSPKVNEEHIQYSHTRVQQVDPARLRANRVIVDDGNSIGLTAYKMLRTQVLQRMTSHNWNALAITSPLPEDGKSLTAVNLAISLARELHHTVLLVDMDLRNPSVHRYLGIDSPVDISDCLLRGVPLSEALINPGIERLVVLPGGKPIANSSEILASPAVGKLVHELKSRYPSRMVIFDLPPVLSADDALSFAPYADAFLLVLRDGKTTRTEVEHAMEVLRSTQILGSVLNASDEKISPYY